MGRLVLEPYRQIGLTAQDETNRQLDKRVLTGRMRGCFHSGRESELAASGRGCVKTVLRRGRPRKTRTIVELREPIARKMTNHGTLIQILFSRPGFSHGFDPEQT